MDHQAVNLSTLKGINTDHIAYRSLFITFLFFSVTPGSTGQCTAWYTNNACTTSIGDQEFKPF